MTTFDRADFFLMYEHLADSDIGPDVEMIANAAEACAHSDDVLLEQVDSLMKMLHQVRLLVMDTDGNWLHGEDFGGLAGAIQEVVVPK